MIMDDDNSTASASRPCNILRGPSTGSDDHAIPTRLMLSRNFYLMHLAISLVLVAQSCSNKE